MRRAAMRRRMPRGTTVNDDWVDDGAHHHHCTMRMTLYGNGNGMDIFSRLFIWRSSRQLEPCEGLAIIFGAGPVLPRGRGTFLFIGWVLYRIRRGGWEVKAGRAFTPETWSGGDLAFWCFGGRTSSSPGG